ncbi:hypothetical protein GQX74_013309 [Glossina fuscipes]|nr:hypothetical protein GQX74_013309 [Glossina fuscipes]
MKESLNNVKDGTNITTCKMFAKDRKVYWSPHKEHVFVLGMILPCLASCLSYLTKTTAMTRNTLSRRQI